MKTIALACAFALTLTGIATAQDAPKSKSVCLRTQNLRNHTVGDDHTLYFNYNGRDVYRLTASNACAAGAISTDPIVMRDREGMICSPIDWDLTIRGSRCIITDVVKLTPAEATALPKGKRP